MALNNVTVFYTSLTGAGGAGAKSAPGVLVGDLVLNVHSRANASAFTNSLRALFENVITVPDQIQQVATVDLANEDPLDLFIMRLS